MLLATVPSISHADRYTEHADRYTEQVKDQLALLKLKAINDGWMETHNPSMGTLRHNELINDTLTLKGGINYLLLSVCDNDCKDLDIKLYDEDGALVAEDLSDDSLPIVNYKPQFSAKYRLKVEMVKCDNNPCSYGIEVLGK